MTKVYLNELINANNSKMLSMLDTANNDIKHMSSDLLTFHDSSKTELVGDGYDAVRGKMELYSDCLNKQSTICINLISNIKSANNKMINFMEGYAELDDSKIPEVEEAIKTAEEYLAWLLDTHEEDGPDENGDGFADYSITVQNGTPEQIAACEALIAKLKHLLEKLKQLASMDKSAFSPIDAVRQDIISYVTALSGIRIPNYDGTFPDDDDNLVAKSLKNYKTNGSKNYYSFWQWDNKWQNSGYHSTEGSDIAKGGCSACSAAACLATIFQDPNITPYLIGKTMGENGWNNFSTHFVEHLATEVYGLDTDLHFGNNYKYYNGANTDQRKELMANLVENGGAVVLAGGRYANTGGHYFAVIGYDASTDTFVVADSDPSVFYKNDDETLQHLTYEELQERNITEWAAIAPPDMTVEEAAKPPTKSA